MSLRHAVLVSLLDGEATGYELAKRFNIAVANYWHAQPAQLYAELNRLETDGLVSATTVVQTKRPNKRVFSLTEAGYEEIRRYAAEPSVPTSTKDDLLVKITGVDLCDHELLIDDIMNRRAQCVAHLAHYEEVRSAMLRGRDEEKFIATTSRVGPYLALSRGISVESDNISWCDMAVRVLHARMALAPKRKRSRPA